MSKKKPQGLAAPGADGKEKYTQHTDEMQEDCCDAHFSAHGAVSDQETFNKFYEETMAAIRSTDFNWLKYEDLFDDKTRQRAFWFILYPESMNPETYKILSEKGIMAAVSPLHDKDYWPDGTKKKSHFHVIIYAPGKMSVAQLKAFVKLLGGVMLEPVANIVGACRYLAHLDIQPDKVEADRGKVRYCVEDIIVFNGFDVNTYVKATQTQISQALKELYLLIEGRNITAYWEFIKFIYTQKPEYEFVMSNPHVCSQISMAIKSRYALLHKDDVLVQQEQIIEHQRNHINMLMGGLENLLYAFEQMGVHVQRDKEI